MCFFSNQIFNLTLGQDVIIKRLFFILAISAFVNWYSSSFDQLISATENVDWIKRRSFIPKLVQILVLVLTILFDLSIEVYFILTTYAFFTILPLSIKKIKQLLPFVSFKPKWNIEMFKEILPYSFNIFSFSIFQYSFWNLRPVFLGMKGTLDMVTDFKIINGLVGVISIVTGSFIGALLPSSSRIVAYNETDKYYKLAYDGTKYVSIIVCMLSF